MTAVWIGLGAIWGSVATLAAIALCMGISDADQRELRSCCPHPESEAPETVRGEFRAVVVKP